MPQYSIARAWVVGRGLYLGGYARYSNDILGGRHFAWSGIDFAYAAKIGPWLFLEGYADNKMSEYSEGVVNGKLRLCCEGVSIIPPMKLGYTGRVIRCEQHNYLSVERKMC